MKGFMHKNDYIPTKKGVMKKCMACGKEIYVLPCQAKLGRKKYCSRECAYKGATKYKTLEELRESLRQNNKNYRMKQKQKQKQNQGGFTWQRS